MVHLFAHGARGRAGWGSRLVLGLPVDGDAEHVPQDSRHAGEDRRASKHAGTARLERDRFQSRFQRSIGRQIALVLALARARVDQVRRAEGTRVSTVYRQSTDERRNVRLAVPRPLRLRYLARGINSCISSSTIATSSFVMRPAVAQMASPTTPSASALAPTLTLP